MAGPIPIAAPSHDRSCHRLEALLGEQVLTEVGDSEGWTAGPLLTGNPQPEHTARRLQLASNWNALRNLLGM